MYGESLQTFMARTEGPNARESGSLVAWRVSRFEALGLDTTRVSTLPRSASCRTAPGVPCPTAPVLAPYDDHSDGDVYGGVADADASDVFAP